MLLEYCRVSDAPRKDNVWLRRGCLVADGLQSVNLYECRQNEGIATVSNRVRYNNGTQIVLADVDWFIKIFELVSYAPLIGRDCRVDSGTFDNYRKSFSNFVCGRTARHLKINCLQRQRFLPIFLGIVKSWKKIGNALVYMGFRQFHCAFERKSNVERDIYKSSAIQIVIIVTLSLCRIENQ